MRRFLTALALTTLALLCLVPAAANAEAPRFWKSCESGSAAGQCKIPRGIGVDPGTPGHLYVADNGNTRIVELSAWGEFVKAWGWGVEDGSPELQTCTAETGCQTGLSGTGTGQLDGTQGVAADSAGAVYVVDRNNHRVQKFGPGGEFLLMFGGDVNQTKVGEGAPEAQRNLCIAASGDVCKIGVEGPGQGQFGSWPVSSFIAVDTKGTEPVADDVVYVGDVNRIQKFDTAGHYTGQVALPEAGQVGSLAADPLSGDLYFAYPPEPIVAGVAQKPDVHRLDPATGEETCTLEVGIPAALASDSEGNVYAFDQKAPNDQSGGNRITRLLKFDKECKFVEVVAQNKGELVEDVFSAKLLGPPVVTGIATGSACLGKGADVYAADRAGSFVRAFGEPPDDPECPPERRAPDIEAQYAVSVGAEEASLEAQVNPHFWSDVQGTTTYYAQYATAACIEAQGWEGACVKEHPAPPGSVLKAGIVDEGVAAPVFLAGLQPATAYRFRFAAQSKDDEGEPTVEGQPVLGVGGKPGVDGSEASFRTFPTPQPPEPCPNDALRSGPSANLPDCRAYEMVSPVDKGNGEIVVQGNIQGDLARLDQAAASGEGLAYSSYRAFGGPQGAPYSSQYIARRGAGGWSSENVSPKQEGPELVGLLAVDALYRYFSPELEEGWLTTATEPVLAPGGHPRYANIYRRDNTGGTYEACTTAEPQADDPTAYVPQPQGVSADQRVAIFRVRDKLTEDASPAQEEAGADILPIQQLYACTRSEGGPRQVRLVSVLPSGFASDQHSSAGTANGNDEFGRTTTLTHALSEDGSRIFWTTGPLAGPGRLYLRLNPSQPQSAQLHGSAQGKGSLVGPAQVACRVKKLSVLSECHDLKGQFAVGQEISGEGIEPGTTITAVKLEFGELKISKKGEKEVPESQIAGLASNVVSGLTTSAGAFVAGQTIAGTGIAPGTTVAAVGASSLTLSTSATQTGAEVPLEAFSECTELEEMACTLQVAPGGRFIAANPAGSRVIFASSGTLFEFDVETLTSEPIAQGFQGVAGTSEDLSRVYFASSKALPVEENSEGDLPVEGGFNLYLYEAGEGGGGGFAFVATLAAGDAIGDRLSPINEKPSFQTARVTPDGGHLAFMSLAQPTHYDNTDRISGKPATEVYLYQADSEDLLCASCNPSGARPVARVVKRSPGGTETGILAAAYIPGRMSALYDGPRALSGDGGRIFFNSYDALALADTNSKRDVYEWEAPETGDCDEENTAFAGQASGCITLLSSGRSPEDSEFIDVDPTGDNVFFTTAASLLAQDPGLVDLYDARAGGGLPPPPAPPAGCEGEACQGLPEPPNDPTPASSTFQGAGNVAEEAPVAPRSCAKGKVRRKGRCVAKHHKRAHKRHRRAAGHNGRAAR